MNIDAIVAAAGNFPPDLDCDELAADLEGIASLWVAGADLRRDPKRRTRDVNRTIDALKRATDFIEKLTHEGDIRLRRHIPTLERIIADVQSPFPSKQKDLLGVERVSAFENAVSMLKTTFERHFKAPAGYTKDPLTGAISGPFIEFADVALREIGALLKSRGISLGERTRAALANALTKVNKHQNSPNSVKFDG
jgi:hypothetical protein